MSVLSESAKQALRSVWSEVNELNSHIPLFGSADDLLVPGGHSLDDSIREARRISSEVARSVLSDRAKKMLRAEWSEVSEFNSDIPLFGSAYALLVPGGHSRDDSIEEARRIAAEVVALARAEAKASRAGRAKKRAAARAAAEKALADKAVALAAKAERAARAARAKAIAEAAEFAETLAEEKRRAKAEIMRKYKEDWDSAQYDLWISNLNEGHHAFYTPSEEEVVHPVHPLPLSSSKVEMDRVHALLLGGMGKVTERNSRFARFVCGSAREVVYAASGSREAFAWGLVSKGNNFRLQLWYLDTVGDRKGVHGIDICRPANHSTSFLEWQGRDVVPPVHRVWDEASGAFVSPPKPKPKFNVVVTSAKNPVAPNRAMSCPWGYNPFPWAVPAQQQAKKIRR